MQRLCTLIVILGSMGAVISAVNRAQAEAASFSTQIITRQQSGGTHYNFRDLKQTSFNSYQISTSSGLLANSFRLRAGAQVTQQDYDSYIIIGKGGENSVLGETFDGQEQSVSAGADFILGSYTLSVDYSGTISKSPLAKKQVAFGLTKDFYSYGAQFHLQVTQAQQKVPRSYFVDPDTFETKSNPPELNPRVIRFSYDQIFTEKSRGSIFVLQGQRPEDRPQHIGMGARGTYALSDTVAVHGGGEWYEEDRDQSLKDPRGYFQLTQYDVGLAYEPTYNLLLRGIYSIAYERESSRANSPEQKIGTDGFDLQLEHQSGRMVTFVQGHIQRSNTGFKSSSFQVGATWEI